MMMFQLYKARLKCLVRSKENIFWSYLFPILLATCFYFTFGNLWTFEDYESISIAYVSEGGQDDALKMAMEEAHTENGTPLFVVNYTSEKEASKLLEDNEIEAYILGDSDPKLYIKNNGLNETIIKSFLDSYRRTSITVQTILNNNPKALEEGLLDDLMEAETFVYEVDNGKRPDVMLIYFYSLLAYTCLFASGWGLDEVINIQANQSHRGARVSVSPVHKMKLFLSNMLAAITAQAGGITLLFIYLYNILKIDFGDSLFPVIVTCMVGSFTGLALGAMVGALGKGKVESKEAIVTAIVLGSSFLTGMMIVNIKYIICKFAPFLNYINPAALITDALYSLYYYDSLHLFYINIGILSGLTVVFGFIAFLGIRRKTYASI
jgi:ABC-2 type transport system permease protein